MKIEFNDEFHININDIEDNHFIIITFNNKVYSLCERINGLKVEYGFISLVNLNISAVYFCKSIKEAILNFIEENDCSEKDFEVFETAKEYFTALSKNG